MLFVERGNTMTNKMTPHDKIKAALEFYVSPYTYQKDMKTGIKDIQNDNGVRADSALALLETHKLVPKYAVVIDDTCGLSKKICTKIATLMLQAGYENAHDYLMETYIRTEIEELISMENNDG